MQTVMACDMLERMKKMCELFGFSGRRRVELNDYLREFFLHSVEHPHGWGISLLERDNYSIEKEPVRAIDSGYLKERLRMPIVSSTMLAHIRLATIGNLEWKNSHPFVGLDQSGRRWTLIHNGTIFDYQPMEKYAKLQAGDTDSERILLHLLELMDKAYIKKGAPLTSKERFNVLDHMVVEASAGNKLNLLIYDEEYLYAHTNYEDSLHQRTTGDGVYFSTQPLKRGVWEPLKFNTLLAYKNGEKVYTGTTHDNEYILDPKKMELLFLAYSGL